MTHIIPHKNKGITHFTIVKILKRFSRVEISEFEKMLNSPFFNNHSTIIKLFGELKKFYPEFSDKILAKEYLFSVVNKGKKYDDKIFRKYLSRINKLAEEYLNIVQIRSEKNKRELNVLIQLSKRDLNEVYSRKLKELEKSFSREIDAENSLLKHQLYTVKYNHKSAQNIINSHNEDLVNSYNNLTDYYLFNTNSIINQINTDKISFNNHDEADKLSLMADKKRIEEYVKELKNLSSEDNRDRILFLDMLIYDMKMNPPESDFKAYRNLKTLIIENSGKLSRQMLYFYLQRLNVFCIIQNVKSIHDMNKELFENYKKMLENDLFSLDGTTGLTLLDLRLILSSALKNNEFDWVEKFIKEKIYLVNEELRINVNHYCYAHLMFYKTNYEGSLEHIQKIKFASLPVTVDIYILKAKIFYMIGHLDSALAVADSFRHYITGNKQLSDFHKVNLMNFVKYFKVMLRLSVKTDKSKIKKLSKELQSMNNTKEKKWLIEKIEALM